MKTHRNAERLIGYLRGQHQPVTVARVVDAGVMSSRDASDARQYGVRHSVIERIRRPGERTGAVLADGSTTARCSHGGRHPVL
ncbi:hypothetical protein [Paraburkholderia aspalathi]|uniref:hypothetical protein n=1 Tax=Paraburkholderia aspalathi TaxID=1324617 RepID=UPI0038BC984F